MKLKFLLIFAVCITYTFAQNDEGTTQDPQDESTQGVEVDTAQPSEETTTQDPEEVSNSQSPNEVSTTKQPPSPNVTEPDDFACPHVGRFPYPNSCSKYYYCWSTEFKPHVFKCPRALDPVTKYCVEHFNSCELAPTCKSDREVSTYPDDKTAFFQCKKVKKDGVISYQVDREYCAKGREFNETLGYCELIDNKETEPNSEEISDRVDNKVCSKVGVIIDFTDDSRYYECIVKSVAKGELKAIKHKCPKGSMFSGETLTCVPIAR